MKSHVNKKVRSIVSLLVKKYQPEKVILFGSIVDGSTKQDSDVDLLLVKQTNKRFYDRIGEVLRILWTGEHTPGIGVDVLVYTPEEFFRMSRQNYFVRDEVLRKGLVAYEKQKR